MSEAVKVETNVRIYSYSRGQESLNRIQFSSHYSGSHMLPHLHLNLITMTEQVGIMEYCIYVPKSTPSISTDIYLSRKGVKYVEHHKAGKSKLCCSWIGYFQQRTNLVCVSHD
jgi:hypothetical protein